MIVEERNYREMCLGQFKDICLGDVLCEKCTLDERNKECPYYRSVTVYELVFIKGGKKDEER